MKVLLTGGLGDFLTCEPFWTDEEINKVEEIVWAARGRYAIEELAVALFPNLKKQTVLFDDWSEVFAVVSWDHLKTLDQQHDLNLDFGPHEEGLIDWSILWIFAEIEAGTRRWCGTRLWDIEFAEIDFPLPQEFAVINPYSPNDRQNGHRDFTENEWNAVIRWLRDKNVSGVVINRSNDFVPDDPALLNLNNMTTVSQAIEVCKKGSYYIGIDSWVPAVMTSRLGPSELFVKSVNEHYMRYHEIYCAPHKNVQFIRTNLENF